MTDAVVFLLEKSISKMQMPYIIDTIKLNRELGKALEVINKIPWIQEREVCICARDKK